MKLTPNLDTLSQLVADMDSILETKFDEAFPQSFKNGCPPRRVIYKEDYKELRDEIIEELTEAVYKHFPTPER